MDGRWCGHRTIKKNPNRETNHREESLDRVQSALGSSPVASSIEQNKSRERSPVQAAYQRRHLISLGIEDQDPQVKRAASELVWYHTELGRFRGSGSKPELPEPDYEYFKQKVQPILTKVTGDGRACVLCHATQGQFPLRMAGKGGFTEAQSQFNFKSVLREVNLSEPQRSLLLLKPTRPNDNAGDPALHTSTHGGGTRWGKSTSEASASEEYETILNWIRGARP